MTAICIGCTASVTGCGGADTQPEIPISTTQATVVKGTMGDGAAPAATKKPTVEPVPGVSKIALNGFTEFVGFRHGDSREAATKVLRWNAKGLGKRKPLEMTGSSGFRFPGHLAISWSTDDNRLDYVSVRSQAAVDYLASKGHTDARLTSLMGRPIGVARSALGKPTLEANRPHAITYRYDFSDAGKHGTLSLEFDKLEEPPTCRSVSVHWR